MEEDKPLTKRQRKKLAKQEKQKAREKGDVFSKIKKYGIWMVIAAVIGFGGFKLIQWINTPTTEVVEEPVIVTEADWIKGNPDALVTLIEYSDFQCPACQSYAPIVRRINEEFPENVRIIYRHFPLTSIHSNAYDAARAAEAAGKQGKFWEMHDILFDKQDEWAEDGSPKDKFESYVEELELDLEAFKNDYDSGEVKDKVDEDIFTGNRLGLSSTPSFILNEQKINNPQGYDPFKALIEAELESN